MITGSIILLIGIFIGYSINFWKKPKFTSKIQSTVNKVLNIQQAKIIDLTPPVDLGNE